MKNSSLDTGCIQANLQRSRTATDLLIRDVCAEKGATISLITEPFFKKSNGSIIGQEKGIKCFSHGKIPRACIISKMVNLCYCPQFSGRDVVTCLIKMNGTDTYFVSAYFDQKIPRIPEKLTLLLDTISVSNIIICTDSNSHSSLWGCDITDSRGEMVEDLLAKHGLLLANVGNVPTFKTSRAQSIIDLTITSPGALAQVKQWHVNTVHQSSDHRRIEFTLGNISVDLGRRAFALKEADWSLFKSCMEESQAKEFSPSYWTPALLDSRAVNFNNNLQKALKRSCRIVTIRSATQRQPIWWSPELGRLRRLVRRLERSSNSTDKELFRSKRKEFSRLIQRSKRSSWQDFVSSPTCTKDMASLCRTISNSNMKSLGLLKGSNGKVLDSPRKTLSLLKSFFFSWSC